MSTTPCPHCGEIHPPESMFCPTTGKTITSQPIEGTPTSTLLTCPHCGEDIEAEWKVCPNCTKKLEIERPCPSCGRNLKAKWKVCAYCGNELMQEQTRKPSVSGWALWVLYTMASFGWTTFGVSTGVVVLHFWSGDWLRLIDISLLYWLWGCASAILYVSFIRYVTLKSLSVFYIFLASVGAVLFPTLVLFISRHSYGEVWWYFLAALAPCAISSILPVRAIRNSKAFK